MSPALTSPSTPLAADSLPFVAAAQEMSSSLSRSDLAASWRRLADLNAEYLKAMLEEAQFDWASSWFVQDPESLYAREWSCQTPMLSIGVHYMAALAEISAAMPVQWMQAWSLAWGQVRTPDSSIH
jgi:hypothetical protein